MSDPRFDGSLDAPPAPNSDWHEKQEQSHPERDAAPQYDGIRDNFVDGCELDLLAVSSSAHDAEKMARELMADFTDQPHIILAAAVMLAKWTEAPIAFDGAVVSEIEQIRARLLRDWVVIVKRGINHYARADSLLRAGWLRSAENALSFPLDAMVAAGEIRRTWQGLYYYEKPFDSHVPRQALPLLLKQMSGTATQLSIELQAAGVRASYYANTYNNLRWMQRNGQAIRHGSMWAAA